MLGINGSALDVVTSFILVAYCLPVVPFFIHCVLLYARHKEYNIEQATYPASEDLQLNGRR